MTREREILDALIVEIAEIMTPASPGPHSPCLTGDGCESCHLRNMVEGALDDVITELSCLDLGIAPK